MDDIYTVLWDYGHIKFWSRCTLTTVLKEAGFPVVDFKMFGRLPLLWSTMVAVAVKPATNPG